MSEKEPPKEEPPIEETDEEKAKKAAVKAGTELTYQQFEDELKKNTDYNNGCLQSSNS